MPWRYSKSEVTIIQAPIKGMPQMDQKTWEKYRGYYSHIKDVARITMEFTTVAAFLEAISAMFNDVGVDVLDLKNRLDTVFSRTNLTDTSFVCFMLFFLLRKSFYDFLVF